MIDAKMLSAEGREILKGILAAIDAMGFAPTDLDRGATLLVVEELEGRDGRRFLQAEIRLGDGRDALIRVEKR